MLSKDNIYLLTLVIKIIHTEENVEINNKESRGKKIHIFHIVISTHILYLAFLKSNQPGLCHLQTVISFLKAVYYSIS